MLAPPTEAGSPFLPPGKHVEKAWGLAADCNIMVWKLGCEVVVDAVCVSVSNFVAPFRTTTHSFPISYCESFFFCPPCYCCEKEEFKAVPLESGSRTKRMDLIASL